MPALKKVEMKTRSDHQDILEPKLILEEENDVPDSKRIRLQAPINMSSSSSSSVTLTNYTDSVVFNDISSPVVTSMHSAIVSSGPSASFSCSSVNLSSSIKSGGTRVTGFSRGSHATITSSNQFIESELDDEFSRRIIRTLAEGVGDSLSRDWTIAIGHRSSKVTLEESEETQLLPQDINFPDPQDSGHMLAMYVSIRAYDAVASTLYVNKVLRYNLTQTDLVDQATCNSPANSGMSPSLSDSFPGFSEKFPSASVEVTMHSTVLLAVELGTLKGIVASMKPKSITIMKSML